MMTAQMITGVNGKNVSVYAPLGHVGKTLNVTQGNTEPYADVQPTTVVMLKSTVYWKVSHLHPFTSSNVLLCICFLLSCCTHVYYFWPTLPMVVFFFFSLFIHSLPLHVSVPSHSVTFHPSTAFWGR